MEKSGKEKVQHASPTARSLASAAASHATSSRVGHGRLAVRLQSMARLLLPPPKKLLAPCSGACVGGEVGGKGEAGFVYNPLEFQVDD